MKNSLEQYEDFPVEEKTLGKSKKQRSLEQTKKTRKAKKKEEKCQEQIIEPKFIKKRPKTAGKIHQAKLITKNIQGKKKHKNQKQLSEKEILQLLPIHIRSQFSNKHRNEDTI